MNATLKLLIGTLLMTTAACSAEASSEPASASDQELAATPPAGGIEMYIDYRARAELRDALGDHAGELDIRDVIVPGVLRVQHQYSIAALRLDVSSWTIVESLSAPDVGPWGVDHSMGVAFPRWRSGADDPGFQAAHAAAKKLFDAMTGAKETRESLGASVVEVKRSTEHGSFVCTKTEGSGAPEFSCTVVGVGEVGSGGLLWSWSTP